MYWGFRYPDKMGINIRVETIAARRGFALPQGGKCVVVLEGFFEWQGELRKPHLARRKNDEPLFLAGIHRVSEGLRQVVILTMPPTAKISWLHNRQPCFLNSSKAIDAWLDPTVPLEVSINQLGLEEEEDLIIHQVPPTISNTRNNTPDNILTLEEYKEKQKSNGIMRFFKPQEPSDGDNSQAKRGKYT